MAQTNDSAGPEHTEISDSKVSAKEYIDCLVSLDPRAYKTLACLRAQEFEGEICIFKCDGRKYTLQPSVETLDHDENAPGWYPLKLAYRNNGKDEFVSFR